MTTGNEDGESSGSDSEPSADNLEEEEMASVIPIRPKLQPPQPPPKKVPAPPPKKPDPLIKKKKEPQSPPAGARRGMVEKVVTRSPLKKQMGYNAFDRLSLRKRKPDMKDAWTQTTPRSDNERRARRHAYQQQLQKINVNTNQQPPHAHNQTSNGQHI